ncbi:RrF2 family transcriptional regulator [Corynebacterium sp. TAE3-ERU16]|uniref:RrF2 family transcriptional regulator n=1 Tax=Corynebacterium sp. TAE3-ERU16 TaxID=2849493 RepID=UPI001C469BC4|nr:Rrf2 family transcriptional regulator [Corynebacterium sp. TAE3-ERU16]
MQLTRFSDLALRTLMRLGEASAVGATRVTVADLAAAIEAPDTHVAKVVSRLAKLGVVRSIRGRSGGVLLSESAPTHSVGALLRELEPKSPVIDCSVPSPCPYLEGDCLLRHRLADATEAFYRSLDDLRVADLIADAAPARRGAVPLGLPHSQ